MSLVARGPHLAAIRANGLRLIEDGKETVHPVRATADPAELGPQDYVILGLKAHSVSPALDAIAPLLGPDTAVVTAQNGMPWWYFYKSGGALEGTRIEAVDPGGRIWERIGPERAIGCVVYPAAEVPEPGVIHHVEGDRFPLGEPSGERTERVEALSKALIAGGLKAPVRPRHPQRDLGQAVGQPLLQPDQRADRRHARRDRRAIPAPAPSPAP